VLQPTFGSCCLVQIKKPLKKQRLKTPEPRLTQTAFFDRSFLGLGAFDLTA